MQLCAHPGRCVKSILFMLMISARPQPCSAGLWPAVRAPAGGPRPPLRLLPNWKRNWQRKALPYPNPPHQPRNTISSLIIKPKAVVLSSLANLHPGSSRHEARQTHWPSQVPERFHNFTGRGQWTEHGNLGATSSVALRQRDGGLLKLIDIYGNDQIACQEMPHARDPLLIGACESPSGP